jgi:tripartite-type tricarboxylate transporter receptor subunit TctC
MDTINQLVRTLIALLLSAIWTGAVAQQVYPDRPIRLIVPYPAGGSSDVMARAFAQKLAGALAVPVVADNRAGAGGNIAASAAAKAPPDGYTLFFGAAGPLAVNPALYEKLPYDPVKDFVPIAPVGKMPLFLAVPVTLNVQSLQEFIALAKARPGELNFASAGVGGTTHLTMEVLMSRAGVNLTHVPYKGTGVADMLGGTIHAMFDGWTTLAPHVQTNKLKFIATSTATRSALEPQVPTMAESGLPGYDLYVWYGLLAPATTPSAVVSRLASESEKIMSLPEIRSRFAALGMEPMSGGPGQFARHIRAETEKWAKIVRESGAKAE